MSSALAFKFTAAQLILYQRRFISSSGKECHLLVLSYRITIKNKDYNKQQIKAQLGQYFKCYLNAERLLRC